MKVGDLVRDKHVKSVGFGCLIKERHRAWDGDWICEVYWSTTKEVKLWDPSWLEVINESW